MVFGELLSAPVLSWGALTLSHGCLLSAMTDSQASKQHRLKSITTQTPTNVPGHVSSRYDKVSISLTLCPYKSVCK